MTDTLFSKIIEREIPADIVFEDDRCIAIRDINPQAPLHVLVIPRKPISAIAESKNEDAELLGHLLLIASRIAEQEGYGEAFRLVVNNGAGAGQTVFHLHVHLLAGRAFHWPPG